MLRTSRAKLLPSRTNFVLTERPNRETAAGLVMAGTIMARADGHVARAERLSWLVFLRRHGFLAGFGRSVMSGRFDQAVAHLEGHSLDALCAEADQLSRLAGTAGARLVAMAAGYVAVADGIAWPQEIAVLQVVRERLGLSARRERDNA